MREETFRRKDWEKEGDSPRTQKQLNFLNAICGCLEHGIKWHGVRMGKDDWRHFLSGTAAGWKAVPAYDHGDGCHGVVMLGGSSLNLTKSQATDAIRMGVMIGDNPDEQNLDCKPIRWSDTVYGGLGWNPKDLEG